VINLIFCLILVVHMSRTLEENYDKNYSK